jgi:hypothetical protein
MKREFRETLWFKKGEMDAKAADDPEGPGAADLMPVEDRYLDDGSLDPSDTASFGVHTRFSMEIKPLPREASAPGMHDDPEAHAVLVRELKRTRGYVLAAMAVSVAAIGVLVWML